MTETLDGEVSYEDRAINDAADQWKGSFYTPSIRTAAVATLTDVLATLGQHGINIQIMDQGRSFASQILNARCTAYDIKSFYLDQEIEPTALLADMVSAAAVNLGRPLEATAPPALNDTRAEIAYVVLPRQPESPSWGPNGDAPLVVSLGQPDIAAANAAASSGAPIVGSYQPGPWTWHLDHRVPGSFFIGGMRVVAPPPSPDVAAEIGVLVADVLTGTVSMPH